MPFDQGQNLEMRAKIRAMPGFRENRDDAMMSMLRPCYMGESTIITWHRPNHNQIKMAIDLFQITMVVTISTYDELPQDIENSCNLYDIKYRRLDLKEANEESLKNDKGQREKLKNDLKSLFDFFTKNEERVLLHCACGI